MGVCLKKHNHRMSMNSKYVMLFTDCHDQFPFVHMCPLILSLTNPQLGSYKRDILNQQKSTVAPCLKLLPHKDVKLGQNTQS